MPLEPRHFTETKFFCPKCGGHCFGSSETEGGGGRVYYCQENRAGCKFRVNLDDLWKHTARVTTTIVPFASHDEYIASLNGRAAGKAV